MPVLAFPGPAAPAPPPVTLEVHCASLDADYDVRQSALETLVVGGVR